MVDIDSLSKSLKGDVVTAADPGYEDAIFRWARNAIKKAKVVTFVKDAEDVSTALKFAQTAGLRVAIRGGGHNPAAASSSEDGLVIDLSRYLDKVTVDPTKKLAYVGGGALWKTVDEEGMKHGLATVGGTINHTGVGGFIVGGGYGFLTGMYGLTIDNLVEATVVIADGRILKASSTENPDLFYGIRGGGSNFGIVTEFVLQLHSHPRKIFAGLVVFTPDKLAALSAVLEKWWANVQPNEAIYVFLGRAPPDGHPVIITNLVYHGTEAEGRERHKAFFDVGPVVDHAKEIPYEALNGLQNDFVPHGQNYFLKAVRLSRPSLEMTQSNFDKVLELSNFEELNVMLAFEYVSHAKVNSVSVDETPYRRDLPGNAMILVTWKDDDPKKLQAAREAAHALAKITPEGTAYGNFTGPDSEALPAEGAIPGDRSQAYFSGAYPKLQALKKKYDPGMVFNKWYPITPAA
ncbi:hypothetical protein BXZ70DRAFT_1016565 [Cristinia sonorae]|uniref:FAD-binding PCMH-type domain-containing protein n=1 Tax=Cristinia sonorae TaxID=1940300 RepID=A0A8K0XR83_9AGAR|nr:hypothetical protein BXZ70DRAFT_1016565 [Cristinia sonorae]